MPARLFLYNTVLLTLGILTLPWVIYQLVFVKKRRQGLAQRFGRPPVMEKKAVWCHAVSVGEVRAISPMLSLLQNDVRMRGRIVLSTVTLTGQETAKRECGIVSRIFYFPLDLPLIVGRAIRRVNPEIFITAETEIWPNFFAACFKRDIPVIVVNGRISDSSFSRYLRFSWFFMPILQRVSLFLMQSDEDARRIREMGARSESVIVTGNMKYDRVPESVILPEEIDVWAKTGFLLIAGSTHMGEEEIILDAITAEKDADILLALVPRHPERFDEVAGILERRKFIFTKFTDILNGCGIRGKIVLVDSMGVLDGFYSLADVAFVGGSLVPVGGHNLLEPAMHGVPVLTGPHTHNFRDIAAALQGKGGCVVVMDSETLKDSIGRLKHPQVRDGIGRAAFEVWRENSGASGKNIDIIFQSQKMKSPENLQKNMKFR